jgi:RNA polymerase sigma factor (TIGR02999 family)
MTDPSTQLTLLLTRIEKGESGAAEDLMPLVYGELRHIAAAKMNAEGPGQTLQATALVHEAWLRLGGDSQPDWKNRAHFFSAAAEAMRRILIDRARHRNAVKRGGGQVRLDMDEADIAAPAKDDELLAINEALEKLAKIDPPKAELVKLRYFVGLSFEETASALGIAVPTAKKWWAYSRAWLLAEVSGTLPE